MASDRLAQETVLTETEIGTLEQDSVFSEFDCSACGETFQFASVPCGATPRFCPLCGRRAQIA